MVLSKNLRVFFLSVLVVLLGISSAMAASLQTVVITEGETSDYYTYEEGALVILKDGIFTFSDASATIESITFGEEGAETGISNVVIRLPKPNPAEYGQGTTGAWELNFPMNIDSNGKALSKTNRANITIEQADVHAAILSAVEWTIPEFVNFTLNAPVRVNATDPTAVTVNITVDENGKMTFGPEGQIYGNNTDIRVATGYITSSATAEGAFENLGNYDITGTMEIQNQYAIIGTGLNATINNDGTLILNMPSVSTLDLRGIVDQSGTREYTATTVAAVGSNILLNGGTLSVPSSLTLIGKIQIGDDGDVVRKGGAGTLTLAQTSTSTPWPFATDPALGEAVTEVQVLDGGLVLSGKPSWELADGATLTTSDDATFTANENAINEENAETFNIKVTDTSTATFKQHSIYKGNEIYPYDNFINKHNGILINVEGVAVDVEEGAKLVIDDAAFPVSAVTGEGTIQINNSDPSKDKAVLILTSADTDTTGFEGTITGSANIGLYNTHADGNFTGISLFPSADATIDNVIVYGPAVLEIDEKADLSNVGAIWLRGNRPGADNTNTNIANSRITVGGLVLANSTFTEDAQTELDDAQTALDDAQATYDDAKAAYDAAVAGGDETEIDEAQTALDEAQTALDEAQAAYDAAAAAITDAVIDLSGLVIKADGTSNSEARATITLGMKVYATAGNIAFYANKDIDFGGEYVAPDNGIYALTINGTTQPSRLIIDGTTVTGEGVAADIENDEKIHQVQMTDGSDVRFLGSGTHYPIGRNNSLYVGFNGKLEMARGAVIDGHLTFAGSTNKLNLNYDDDGYPNDSWFAADDNYWNSSELDGYSTFTTVLANGNRISGTTASEYAVQVGGDLMLSSDENVTPGTAAYPGRVLVRLKTNTNAFDGVTETALQRFKVVGTTGDSSEYTADYETVRNDTYLWRIAPQTNPDGVVVETRAELVLVSLGEFQFTSGADTFGNGEFTATAPVTAWGNGKQLTIARNTTGIESPAAKYTLSNGNEIYYVSDANVYFRTNIEGEEAAVSNVFDEDAWTKTFSSPDAVMNGTFGIAEDGTPEVTLRGNSYGGYKFVDVTVMLVLTPRGSDYDTMQVTGILPAFKDAPLSPSGYGDKTSNARVEQSEPTVYIAGENAILSFSVYGLTELAGTEASSLELVNGAYVWRAAAEGSYRMPNESGYNTTVTNLRFVRFEDAANLTEENATELEEKPVITIEGDHAVVSGPSSILGNTGENLYVVKYIALRGDKADGSGTLTTRPLRYTLITETDPADIISGIASLNQVAQIGGTPASGKYDVMDDFADDPTGNVKLLPVDLPAWLGYNGGGETISYTTGDLTGVTPGTHKFRVIAYTDNTHKVYEFNVTVADEEVAALELTLSPEELHVAAGEAGTVTATAANNVGGVEYSLTMEETLNWVSVDRTTGVITVNAPETEGTYTVTVVAQDDRGPAGQATKELKIVVGPVVISPDLMIQVSDSTTFSVALDATRTIKLTPRNVEGTVTYESSAPSWVTVSNDGTVTVSPTDSALVSTTPHTVTITATDTPHASGNGTATVTLTITVTGSGALGSDLMLTASETSIALPLNTDDTSITLTTRNVQGTVTYETSASWVDVEEDEDGTVYVSIEPTDSALVGVHTVTITATDTPHTNGNGTATVTLTITVTNTRIGSSSGGCDAGFGALALLLAAPLFLRRRRS